MVPTVRDAGLIENKDLSHLMGYAPWEQTSARNSQAPSYSTSLSLRKGEKLHDILPLLRLTCRPDQNQIVDNYHHRIALLDYQETCHWCSHSDTCVGVGRHRVDVMRDDDQLMLGGVCEYFGVRALVHADITGTDELDGWLATYNTTHKVLVEIMISKKSWPTHEASGTS